jgi:hypothetical protein
VSWIDRVLQTMQTAAVIGERVERMSNEVAGLAVDLREIDRRVAQLEGAFAVVLAGRETTKPPSFP